MSTSNAMPTFSIVMPAYNSAASIGSAIESVLQQTRADFELIIIDDGSTDETASRVQPYLRDARIGLFSQWNLGPATARNRGIASARGEYVSFLDSDDLWLPPYLATMAETLDADATAAVAYTDAWVLDDASRRIRRVTAMSPWHPPAVPEEPQDFLRALIERGNYVFAGTTIHRWMLEKVGAFRSDIDGVEDYELWLRIAAHGYRFVRCPLNLAIYRRRPGQLSADARAMLRTAADVYRIVAEEYDIPDEIRELAHERAQEQMDLLATRDSPQPRRVPRALKRPYDALSRLRHFYMRPPREIREIFPDLHAL
jgi:glycosyltransferase involved in cell wall biosynthesis